MGPLIIWLRHFFVSKYGEKGATAIEYGLIVALIAVAIIIAVTALGEQLEVVFDYITTKLALPS